MKIGSKPVRCSNFNCRSAKMEIEQLSGMPVYRIKGAFRIYRVRCSECGTRGERKCKKGLDE